jgi:hypothetical protein
LREQSGKRLGARIDFVEVQSLPAPSHWASIPVPALGSSTTSCSSIAAR